MAGAHLACRLELIGRISRVRDKIGAMRGCNRAFEVKIDVSMQQYRIWRREKRSGRRAVKMRASYSSCMCQRDKRRYGRKAGARIRLLRLVSGIHAAAPSLRFSGQLAVCIAEKNVSKLRRAQKAIAKHSKAAQPRQKMSNFAPLSRSSRALTSSFDSRSINGLKTSGTSVRDRRFSS